MHPTKRNSIGKGKERNEKERKRKEKSHAARFEAVKQGRHDNKTGKTYSSGVALLVEDQDQQEATTNHQRKSSTLCPFFQGKTNHSTGIGISYMCIQCGGWRKFATPCTSSGKSNGHK